MIGASLLSVGCVSTPGEWEPAVLSISPGSAQVGKRLQVVIGGNGFVLKPSVSLAGTPPGSLEGALTAEIGGLALEELVLVSEHELSGVLPAGLPVGTFDVVVTNGFGKRAALLGGFVIADGRDGGSGDAGSDAGFTDAGDADAGDADAGDADAGFTDAGDADAGFTDAGDADAGFTDAGSMDAGSMDAGSMDAGSMDAGSMDAGSMDAGSMDAGSMDAGRTDAGADAGEILTVFIDPFGDGTTGTFVFGYRGKVYVGPNRSGAQAVRFDPSGADLENVSFAFTRDVTGHVSANASPPPYPSIGTSGCTANTPACGPDNENGRGLFFETQFADAGWLGVAGAKSSAGMSYAYFTSETGTPLNFSYVDLSALLGAGTRELSSAQSLGGRTYLGFGGTAGSKRPSLVVLLVPPAAPGIDASAAQAIDLGADLMPGLNMGGASTNNIMVDAIGSLNDRLYLGAFGGWMRSTVSNPRSFGAGPADWAGCTPSVAAYAVKTSTTTTLGADLEPADRAVPGFASYGGRLYAARNTTTGPQLWGCNPATTASATECDPGDWYLVAPNTTGDLQLTQFNDPANTKITLLRASTTHLYVGFNNLVRGAVVLRSLALTPSTRADFTGASDCAATQYPATCRGFGGNGFGSGLLVNRIIDSVIFSAPTTDYLFVVAGNGVAAARVLRLGP